MIQSKKLLTYDSRNKSVIEFRISSKLDRKFMVQGFNHVQIRSKLDPKKSLIENLINRFGMFFKSNAFLLFIFE